MTNSETPAMSKELQRALKFKVNEEVLDSDRELADVERITIYYETSWQPGIERLTGLKRLYIERSNLPTLQPLSSLTTLERIEVKQSTLSDISAIEHLKNLRFAHLEFNFIEDISPLLELPELKNVYVPGNPLSEKSYREVIPQLEERGVYVWADDEEIWRLCLRLHSRDSRAVYGGNNSTSSRGNLVVPELQFEYFQQGVLGRYDKMEIEITPEEIEEALEADDFDAAELALEHWTPPYSYSRHHEVDELDDAKQHLADSPLHEALVSAVGSMIDRIDADGYVCEDDKIPRMLNGRLYEWRSYPDQERPGLPDWFCTLRTIAAYPIIDDEEAGLQFGDGDDIAESLRGETITLKTPGITGSEQAAVVDHRRLYPFGWGPGCRWALCLRLGDPDDEAIYRVEKEHVFIEPRASR